MSRNRVILITVGLMLSLFLASMESTVIATAMPTIVSQLGGLESYSWVFSAYMLASTTTVPLFGKLSDIFGRRPVYACSLLLFLVGSLLCGQAQSMPMLIAFRVVQGLGAGGLMPLAITIIGDLFTFEQRARMQGLFSGVWGVSAVVGPLLGGFLVDQASWRWVFLINLGPGLLAGALVWLAWVDQPRDSANRPSIDWAGAAVLTLTVVLLLLALLELGQPVGWGLLVGALLSGALLVWIERRAADPIVPLGLFGDRMFAVANLHGVMAGCALFGLTSFVPLFAQAVLGTSPTAAGAVLSPMLIGWVLSSIVGSRLLLKVSARLLAVLGTGLLLLGTALVTQIGEGSSQLALGFDLALMGVGMGLGIPAFLIAVQSTVERRFLGVATSTVQFSRSIGGTIGVSLMGAVLSTGLSARLAALGLDQSLVDQLLSPEGAGASAAVEGPARLALAGAMQGVFIAAAVASALAFIAVLFTPAGRIDQLAANRPSDDTSPAHSTLSVGD
ncbi:MAG: MDR family MFS transporter [Roseiflexaceae bacterium]